MRTYRAFWPFLLLALSVGAASGSGSLFAAQSPVPGAASAVAPASAVVPPAPAATTAAAASATVGLAETLAELGAVLSWDPISLRGALETGGHRIVFRAYGHSTDSYFVLDGKDLVSAPAPLAMDGKLVFPRAFVESVRASVRKAAELERSRFRIAVILVDPGHGGKDTGAVATHLLDGKKTELVEKDIALEVASRYHALLSAAYPDKQVLITRKGDTFPSLEQRVSIANSVRLAENEAIVFVSIHANASFNKKARGYETWFLSPEYRRTVIDAKQFSDSNEVLPILNDMMEEEFTMESVMIARSIMKRFDEAMAGKSPSRGIKAEEWFVVRNARMPSVLVELGFVTNPEDARMLADPAHLRKLSEALYSGTVDFVRTFEKTGGFTATR